MTMSYSPDMENLPHEMAVINGCGGSAGRRDRHFRVGGHEPFVLLIENGAFNVVV